ncbi:UNVERIFIED_CONTAM: hypothetical protein HDU68_003231 [Siphonaria sp. JEL0065]|nr:hypothetical protein HDU68_003231 [Siphonaria sp. JEL0065]
MTATPTLPIELFLQILGFVPAEEALRLRRISRSVCEFVCSVSFAKVSLSKLTPEAADQSKRIKLLFFAPPGFQSAASMALRALTHLQLGGSSLALTAIPRQIKALSLLTRLDLGYTGLCGQIPLELTELRHLASIRLCGNNLDGPLPESIGNWKLLHTLNLASNRFSGSLPTSTGDLPLLQHLILWENQLSGEIPIQLGKLVKLQDLFLGKNRFCGVLTDALFRGLTNLSWVSLSDNQFTGVIPDVFGRLDSLQYLRVKGNGWSGPISEGVMTLIRSRRCDISEDCIVV